MKKHKKAVNGKNIYVKIFNVQSKLKTVLKSTQHGHNKYMYATERDFIAEVKPLLAVERLALHATTLAHVVEGKQHRLEVKFTLINVDKPTEKLESVFWGCGDDKEGSVVGTPIAYTMALKYYFAKTFIAETGTDAEAQVAETPTKGKVKAPTAEATPEEAYGTIMSMIKNSRNSGGLIDYDKKVEKMPFTATQKKEIHAAISSRVDELDAGTAK